MTISQTASQRAYFRGDRRFGRTTKLVVRNTGEVLAEFMGCLSRREAFGQWKQQQALRAVWRSGC